MSYRGRPSKGCDACRARKIKCDERKPKCNKCIKSNYDCNYRDQSKLVFRNQTAIAAQKAEDLWRKRATKSQPGTGSEKSQESPSHDHLSEAAIILNLDGLSLAQEVEADLLSRAYQRWLYDFVIEETPGKAPDEPSDSLMDFVPHMYENASEKSSLKCVIRALALLNFSSRCNHSEAQILAAEYAGSALRSLGIAIADVTRAASDETLLTVYLMGMYENLSSSQFNGSFLAHKEGANALLRLRDIDEFYKNPITARLYEMSYVQMLIGNIQSAKPPTLPLMDFFKPATSGMHGTSGIYIVRLIHAATTFHASWHTKKQGSPPPWDRENLRDLLNRGLELDSEFQAWEKTLPTAWYYHVKPNTPEVRAMYDTKWQDFLNCRGAPEEAHVYPSLRRCWVWMLYRTTRMFLLRDIIEILNWMLKLPDPSPEGRGDVFPAPDADISPTPQIDMPMPLDSMTLQIHLTLTIGNLVDLIEQGCAAVIGHFTVPIFNKSTEDVVGMRGYTVFWALGVMDAILRMGLVPDTASFQPSVVGASRTPSPLRSGSVLPSFYDCPSLAGFEIPSHIHSPFYYSDIQTDGQQHQANVDPAVAAYPSTHSADSFSPPATNSFVYNPSSSVPRDTSVSEHSFEFSIASTPGLDVSARRDWITKILSYLGHELGIRKALAVLKYGGQFIPGEKQDFESTYGKYPAGRGDPK